MRWIACCFLAAVVGVGLSAMLIEHLASKPSDPNLAELGLASNLDELVAPDEPELAAPPRSDAGVSPPERLDGIESEIALHHIGILMPPAQIEPPVHMDENLKPVSYIDTAGAIELGVIERQWMPLCTNLDCEPNRFAADYQSSNSLIRMPRCDEPRPPLAPPQTDDHRR